MVLMPGFQSTQLATEGALEPFFFLYTDDSIQGNPETCKQSSIMLNYEVKNNTPENARLPERLLPVPDQGLSEYLSADDKPLSSLHPGSFYFSA